MNFRFYISFLIIACLGNLEASGQMKGFYGSQEMEIIFSLAEIDAPGTNVENILRFSPVFNFMGYTNLDFGKNFGIYGGLGFRNVGFIADFPDTEDDLRIKYRTYNAGVPIGFKIGNLDQKNPRFLFAGYELELPFHYKEKRFENGDKVDKITSWFTNRTDVLAHAVFAGFQFPNGVSLKMKYYLSEFFNSSFVEYIDDPDGNRVGIRPFENLHVNVFYFSLSFYPFRYLGNRDESDSKSSEAPFISAGR